MNKLFPFSAVVGQDDFKTALLANAVDPSVGGLLVKGPRGTGKSTLARSLTEILPDQSHRKNCPVRCSPERSTDHCPICRNRDEHTATKSRPRFVELPLGATPDQVTGTLNVKDAVERGETRLDPGLLARANRGILYVDEVNLLPDRIVDLLLDAAASGTNRVERDGVSVEHESDFVLVGTMNPDEGQLRPQLRDRFGLSVEVGTLTDPRERTEVAERVSQYQDQPEEFRKKWQSDQARLRERVNSARNQLASVTLRDGQPEWIAERVLESGAEGHRADIVIRRTARVLAALDGRDEVNQDDLERAFEFAILHRRPTDPSGPSGPSRDREENHQDPFGDGENGTSSTTGETVIPPDESTSANFSLPETLNGDETEHRPSQSSLLPDSFNKGRKLDLSRTITKSARRNQHEDTSWSIDPEELVFRRRNNEGPTLILWLLDASGSMARNGLVGYVKSVIHEYSLGQKEHWMSLVEFRKRDGWVKAGPTRRYESLLNSLDELPVGGRTPILNGFRTAKKHADEFKSNHHNADVTIPVLSDGRFRVTDELLEVVRDTAQRFDVVLGDVESESSEWGTLPLLANVQGIHYQKIQSNAA